MYANGRTKRGEPYVRHFRWQLNCPAWKSLSMTARCLEMELKALYNGINNGDLFLSVREAAKRLGVANNTAGKAFKELEERGFIRPKQRGSFDWKLRHATAWVLTEFEYANQPASKDFMKWHLEEKTRTQKITPSVLKFDTAAQNLTPCTPLAVSNFKTETPQNDDMPDSKIETQVSYHAGVANDVAQINLFPTT
jgi:DNA-binding transcriptional MocR family regulator